MKTMALGTMGVILSGLAAVVGCGRNDRPGLAPVSGVVTLNSKPLAGVVVVFQPKHGKASRGFTDVQGRYELTYLRDIKGAVLGPHKVSITTDTERGPGNSPEPEIPDRVNRQTELTAQVKPGPNTIDFNL